MYRIMYGSCRNTSAISMTLLFFVLITSLGRLPSPRDQFPCKFMTGAVLEWFDSVCLASHGVGITMVKWNRFVGIGFGVSGLI